jgi:hypothetical protein
MPKKSEESEKINFRVSKRFSPERKLTQKKELPEDNSTLSPNFFQVIEQDSDTAQFDNTLDSIIQLWQDKISWFQTNNYSLSEKWLKGVSLGYIEGIIEDLSKLSSALYLLKISISNAEFRANIVLCNNVLSGILEKSLDVILDEQIWRVILFFADLIDDEELKQLFLKGQQKRQRDINQTQKGSTLPILTIPISIKARTKSRYKGRYIVTIENIPLPFDPSIRVIIVKGLEKNVTDGKLFEETTNKLKQELLSQCEEQEKSIQPATDKPDVPQDQIIKTIETILSPFPTEQQQEILGNLLKIHRLDILKVVIPDNKAIMEGAEKSKAVAPVETAEIAEQKIDAMLKALPQEEYNKLLIALRNRLGLTLNEGEPSYKKNPLSKRVDEFAAFEWPKNILALKIVWEKVKENGTLEEEFITQQVMRQVLGIKHKANISFGNVTPRPNEKYLYAKWRKEDRQNTGKPICRILGDKLLLDNGLTEELKKIAETI